METKPTSLPSLGVETTNAIFGGKWRPLILLHLILLPRHFGQILLLIPGLSKKILTHHLCEMETEGIISRRVTGTPPAPVEYALTDYGRSVIPVLDAMCKWGHQHAQRLPRHRRKTTEIAAKGVQMKMMMQASNPDIEASKKTR